MTATPEPPAIDTLFEQSMRDIEIPPCPDILNNIMEEARKSEPDFNRLASLIKADVSLSAGLIKTVNSPYFGMRRRVGTIHDALIVLGLDVSKRAIAGIVLRDIFPVTPAMERFWDASARIARISGWLAQKLQLPGLLPEDAYTLGLFRDCGIPVLLLRFPDYDKVLGIANSNAQHSFTSVEETVLPTNHAMVGCILAQSWWLPEELCLAIRNHHDLPILQSAESRLPMLSRRLIATAQLAEHILQHECALSSTQEWPKLGATCLRLLNLQEEDLEQLYAEGRPIAEATE
ncbi:MAG: HDOD domain-containing protein [Sideroxydans sp.]|nr:HDOD domain-containing protein [Sideroxydans sp.]